MHHCFLIFYLCIFHTRNFKEVKTKISLEQGVSRISDVAYGLNWCPGKCDLSEAVR